MHRRPKKTTIILFVIFLATTMFQANQAFANPFASFITFDKSQNPFATQIIPETIIFSATVGSALTSYIAPKILESKQIIAQQPFNPADFGTSANRAQISSIDSAFFYPYNKTLHLAGTATAGLSMIAPAALLLVPQNTYFSTAIMYAETMTLAFAVKNTIKNFVDKPRPYMYFDNYPLEKVQEGDYNRSFPSGHTTYAFAGATFATYLSSKLLDSKAAKITIAVASYTLATTTAVLRVASGNHFLTDVLAGAVIGSACGFAVPFLHEHLPSQSVQTNKKSNISSAVTPFAVSVRMSF